MENVDQLLEISEKLGRNDISLQLAAIKQRQQEKSAELIIPLVGEYSAGKTSLLNSLTTIQLETAIVPTTATIFEVRFSNDQVKAIVNNENGASYEIENIESLKNKDLLDVKLVQVYDSSTKIPPSVVLVDTPGISSLEPRHQKALTSYLPLADVILVVVDIQQGVTASVLKFINTTADLVKKRLYVVITKCDTKPEADREKVKQYIKDNSKIPIEKVVCVSARSGGISELTALISEIQQDKNYIIGKILEQRTGEIQKEIVAYLDEMISSSGLSTDELDQKIAASGREVQRMQSNINGLLSELAGKISNLADDAVGEFDGKIFNELEEIAKNPPGGGNINQIVNARIESISNLMFGNFKTNIKRELGRMSRENQNMKSNISLPALDVLNLSNLSLGKLTYNIDMELPELQALNKKIAGGIKLVAAAGAAVAGAAVAGAVALGSGAVAIAGKAVAGSGVANGGNLIDVVDTVSDIGSMVSNRNTRKSMAQMAENIRTNMGNGMNTLNKYDEQATQYIPMMQNRQRGAIESVVGMITERTHAKPQRKRLIDDFIFSSLQPEFKQRMTDISESIIDTLRNTLYAESEAKMNQLREGLETLKTEKDSEKNIFNQKIEFFQNCRKSLEA